MFWRPKLKSHPSSKTDSRVSDYCSLFLSKMGQLYWLAYILTANPAKAEECYMHALERCLESPYVIKEQEEVWARRMIIKSAIAMMSPFCEQCPQILGERLERRFPGDWLTSALLALDLFDRFPFVMAVLEQYSIQECAVLLRCGPSQVIGGKIRALRHIAKVAATGTYSAIAVDSNHLPRIGRML